MRICVRPILFLTVVLVSACSPEQKAELRPFEYPRTQFGLTNRPEVDVVSPTTAVITLRINESASIRVVAFPVDQSNPVKDDALESSASLSSIKGTVTRDAFVRAWIFESIELRDLLSNQVYSVMIEIEQGGEWMRIPDQDINFRTPASLGGGAHLAPIMLDLREGVSWSYSIDGQGQASEIKLEGAPKWLEFDQMSGEMRGIPVIQSTSTDGRSRIDVRDFGFSLVSTLEGVERRQDYQIHLLSDPLAGFSWHLENKGQSAFAYFSAGDQGETFISAVHQKDILGRGVSVRIVDTGLQVNHEDLSTQVPEDGHVNFEPSASGGECIICDPNNPTPVLAPRESGDTGTALAGLIGATGWNDKGARGVAPEVKLISFNPFSKRIRFDPGMLYESLADGVDIVTFTHPLQARVDDANPQGDDVFESLLNASTLTHRNGLGMVVLKSVGDLHREGLDAAVDPANVLPWLTVVGSVNGLGKKSSESSIGSSLWISAPGGEKGFQSEFAAVEGEKIRDDFLPGLISTDIYDADYPCKMGFAKGPGSFVSGKDTEARFFVAGSTSGFNLGWSPFNRECSYTSTTHGSSAATAVVAGVVALMLEANPSLTWRDVRNILAVTAGRIDPDKPAEYISVDGHQYISNHHWIKNAAGFNFHNWYGFGLVNAKAAVEMALSSDYLPIPPQMMTSWVAGDIGDGVIPANSITGKQSLLPVSETFKIEVVQVKFDASHEDVSHLQVELISPSGTRSVLVAGQNARTHSDYRNLALSSNAFYGESSKGDWRLQVTDTKAGRKEGKLLGWSIRFMGHYY